MAKMPNFLIVQSIFNANMLKEQGINLYDSTDLENSDKFRIEGNLKFKEGKYFAAIAQYNKALICGRNDKVRSSLCYANRSAVYLELKYFKHCLHNIQLAEVNYPRANIQKLHERREKCLKMMKNSVDKATDAFVHTFKLSFEKNPKLPFFIDSLELRENSRFGKHLVSTRDLKAGDVIAVIDPWRDPTNSLVVNYVQGCYTCHDTNNGDLITGECKALFCSEHCKSKHDHQNSNHEVFNELENVLPSSRVSSDLKFLLHMHDVFGSVDEMKKFVDEHPDKQYTVFDFDWSDPTDPMYYKNMLLTMLNKKTKDDDDDDDDMVERFQKACSSFLKPDSQLYRILNGDKRDKFLDEILLAIRNQMKIALTPVNLRWEIADFFHPSDYLLILSSIYCEANVITHTNRKDLVWTTNKPITAGTPIVAYTSNTDWSIKKNEIVVDRSQENLLDFFMVNDHKNLTNLLQYFKSCCDFINQNFDSYKNDQKMELEINSKILEMEATLVFIGNPFAPSNPYLNMDKFFKPVTMKKYQKSLELESENFDV